MDFEHSSLNTELAVDRQGYCAWCNHLSQIQPLPEAKMNADSVCHGCWMTDDKKNWKPREQP